VDCPDGFTPDTTLDPEQWPVNVQLYQYVHQKVGTLPTGETVRNCCYSSKLSGNAAATEHWNDHSSHQCKQQLCETEIA